MQPNLKGAGLAGPLSQGSSLTQQWAGLAGGGQPGLWAVLAEQRWRSSAAEPEAQSPGGCAVTALEWELGISAQGTPPARSWLGKG